MAIELLYFASVRERIGRSQERLALPPDIRTLGALLGHLRARGEGYAEALAEGARVRCAINQEFAEADAALAEGDEVALFPPITGG
ncbi:molybdopterin converting factor subunit 1 [Acidisoma sp. C75]